MYIVTSNTFWGLFFFFIYIYIHWYYFFFISSMCESILKYCHCLKHVETANLVVIILEYTITNTFLHYFIMYTDLVQKIAAFTIKVTVTGQERRKNKGVTSSSYRVK